MSTVHYLDPIFVRNAILRISDREAKVAELQIQIKILQELMLLDIQRIQQYCQDNIRVENVNNT